MVKIFLARRLAQKRALCPPWRVLQERKHLTRLKTEEEEEPPKRSVSPPEDHCISTKELIEELDIAERRSQALKAELCARRWGGGDVMPLAGPGLSTFSDVTPLAQQRNATNATHWTIYLDYNGVLNAGQPDKLKAMCEFLVSVTQIKASINIRLLSFAPSWERQAETLAELDEAAVMDLFDDITFTTRRHRFEKYYNAPGNTSTGLYEYDAVHPYASAMLFEVFRGGKDTYIRSQHTDRSDAHLILVDDKAAILKAAGQLTSRLRCVEMRRHHFISNPSECYHVRGLDDLYDTIYDLTCH